MIGEDAPFLTLEDVKGFLASCEEEDEVGTPDLAPNCLAAETLRWKYGKGCRNVYVLGHNTMFEMKIDEKTVEGFIDFDLMPLLDEFDQIRYSGDYPWYDFEAWATVTKAQLHTIGAFDELFAEGVSI